MTTVRSQDKAQRINETYKEHADRLQTVIVPDIAQEHAFDEVAKTPGLEVVLHTASPFHFNFSDPQRELIDPALIGTTAILRAIHRDAPTVRRVVVTSSLAAILDKNKLSDGKAVFTEKSWNPATIDEIHEDKPTAYRVSKTLAERAAWDFVEKNKPNFDLATVNPPLVLGPVVHYLATLDAINTSNGRVVSMLRGDWKSEIPATGGVPYWVDVRDVADAHIIAMDKPECGGQRLFTLAGEFSNREIVDIVRKNVPAMAGKLPAEDVKGGEPNDPSTTFKADNSLTTKLLGVKWTSLQTSIVDLANSLKEFDL